MRAKDVMSGEVMSVSDDATVFEAAELLVNTRVSGMPVVDKDGVMIGLVTEADLMRHTGAGAPKDQEGLLAQLSDQTRAANALADAKSTRVVDVMTKGVTTAGEDATLREIVDLMLARGIKRVPILRDRSIVGIVSRADLLQALISGGPAANAQRPPGRQTADDGLRSAVLAAVQGHSWSQARRCDVVVSGTVIHLWGMVPNDSVRRAYVEAAGKVPGVSSIENHMHVARRSLGA